MRCRFRASAMPEAQLHVDFLLIRQFEEFPGIADFPAFGFQALSICINHRVTLQSSFSDFLEKTARITIASGSTRRLLSLTSPAYSTTACTTNVLNVVAYHSRCFTDYIMYTPTSSSLGSTQK